MMLRFKIALTPLNRVRFNSNSIQKRSFSSTTNSQNNNRYRILFFGTDSVALPTLKLLHQDFKRSKQQSSTTNSTTTTTTSSILIDQLEVVCATKISSSAAIEDYCSKNSDLKLYRISANQKIMKETEIPSILDRFNIAVVVSFGRLIPSSLIASLKFGGINMHPSLLPKYRGPAPIYHTMLNGDKETGVTVLELSPNKFDSGKILSQLKVKVNEQSTLTSLSGELAEIGSKSIMNALANLDDFRSKSLTQDESKATHAPKVKKEMGFLQFSKHSVSEIHLLWRSLGQTIGVHCNFLHSEKPTEKREEQQIDVVRLVQLAPIGTQISYQNFESQLYSPGMCKFDKNQNLLFIKCLNEEWLAVQSLQVTGRKILNAEQFSDGYKLRELKKPSKQAFFE